MCSDENRALCTDLGVLMAVNRGLEDMESADLIILLPTGAVPPPVGRALADALRCAYRRGTIIAAFGTGTWLLAGTGLLDGRRAAADPALAGRLAAAYPAIAVERDVPYVDEGGIVTGADGAAGIDMCLHLLRREHGGAVRDAVARDAMIVACPSPEPGAGLPAGPRPAAPRPVGPRPAGPRLAGQRLAGLRPADSPSVGSPSVGSPSAGGDEMWLADLLVWARDRLQQSLSVAELAQQALMSTRTFARRFREVTGTTPYAWLNEQRLDQAEELLRTTDLSVEKIAHAVGFASSGALRAHFGRRHGVSPRAYRQTLARSGARGVPPDEGGPGC
ncbi:GlxA family transcriptional regulator [Nonomuraea sp. NPDC050783]|uniref:GlxA family transcriptional regulator n=1 Tax=Nonomuraea sp. NPDC050783 TaxID=3154634 RepID=UPI003466217F